VQDLTGKTAVVTGAASGIGLGIARNFARAGMNLVLADIEAAALERARAEVAALGAKAIAVVTDVSDRAAVGRLAAAATAEFGRLHVAVSNAGVSMHGEPAHAIEPRNWDWIIGVNIYGVIHGIQAFLPLIMSHGEGGHIVNTASIGGLQVNPNWYTSAYSMTKFAVVALSEALEQELKDTNIGVSVLCPAAVDTAIYRSARNRPERFGGPAERPQELFMKDLLAVGWPPDRVGARVVDAIRAGEFYVLAQSAPRTWIERRHARLMEAFDRAAAWDAAHPR
jgi:NAD(P)-dependent dehydrogenase (short-subunit alcohol dehydrogenase family)